MKVSNDFTITNRNDLQDANDFCDQFLYHTYDLQNFRYFGVLQNVHNFEYNQDNQISNNSQDTYNNSYIQFFQNPYCYLDNYEVPEACDQLQSIHYSVFGNVQSTYIQDHNLQNTYDTSNAQFFHNGFDTYQEQDIQESRDYF
ncbi:20049_t:CDS:2 [Dentiscutata erythropus]|uniref:20049_t:CDS:1 n=1 Tax=Dentiscutata erythropus TaxID=1348616 RepID=A0A9N9E587_9GLOM|nr:20049_t:CDS:2 [Dentiscutata erythropus]